MRLEKASKAGAPSETNTKGSKLSSADLCRANGWEPGTLLAGDEGYGQTVIKITSIGERGILARVISHNGEAIQGTENSWALHNRTWRKYGT